MGRRSRKRASTATAARSEPVAHKPSTEPERKPSRSELKNVEARAKLKPLEPGERPLAVKIGALATVAVIVANLVVYFAGVEVRGDRPAFVGFLAFCALMGVMAWGLWNARYWAVLGLEALLGILILIVALVAMLSSSITDALICVAILVPSIALFWFLIKAMARIQMPERPG